MPVARHSSSQRRRAYDRLRRLLILQQIPAGERLREAQWARKLGVHRTGLREAFARLEAEGFIVAGPNTGYFVPNLSEQDVREVAEIRMALEGIAIDRICRLGLNKPKHLKALREAADRFHEFLGGEYLLGAAEADRRFHEAIIEAAGNRRLATLYRRAPLPLIHREMVSQDEWLAVERRAANEHKAIVAAILGGNAARARRLLEAHLTARSSTPARGFV
jgi:DNA-binding GntR family transcriptional regulator